MYAPRLVNDTIFGMTGMSQSCMLNKCIGQEVTIGILQVQSFRVRELNKPMTFGLIGAGAAGVVVMAAALSGHGADMGCVGLCSTNSQVRTSGISFFAERSAGAVEACALKSSFDHTCAFALVTAG